MKALLSGSPTKPVTMMSMIGSHTMGLTGLKSAMNGVIAAMMVGLSPHKTPTGTATAVPMRKPTNTHMIDRSTW